MPTTVRQSPRTLEVLTAPGSWGPASAPELFDRDTASRFVPPVDEAGLATLRVVLDRASSLTHVKVFGPSPYWMEVRTARGAVPGMEKLDLSALGPGWHLFRATELPGESDRVELSLTRTPGSEDSGEGAPSLGDIELWTLEHGIVPRVTRQLLERELARSAPALPAHVDELKATPAKGELSAVAGTSEAPCVRFAFSVTRDPTSYRAAWLSYRLDGAFRPFALSRALNDGPKRSGIWAPATEAGEELVIEPLDPEGLRAGENHYQVCLPSDALGQVRLSGVRVFGELEHGSNLSEAAGFAPGTGIATRPANELLGPDAQPHSFEAGERLVVGFERWVSPDAVLIDASTDRFSLYCLDDAGGSAMIETEEPISQGSSSLIIAKPAEDRRCSAVALEPGLMPAEISHVSLFGSGARRRIDWPRLSLASAPEHFGLKAWVDGWANAPTGVVGPLRVDVGGLDIGTEKGVFARLLDRTGDSTTSWPVGVTAHLADGSSYSKTFVLEASGEVVPIVGSGTIDPPSDDGLTEDERVERYGTVGDSESVEATGREARSVRLGTHVGVDVPEGATESGGQGVTVAVAHLAKDDIPPLDPGLHNVTAPFARGYEFLPHGQVFEKPVKLLVPYQENLIPPGYSPEDVHTYFFDEEGKRWRRLSRDTVDSAQGIVHSQSDHFTVMINAVVTAPEHPQVSSFNPTEISDIQVANPSAKVNLIEPPEASSKGDAVLSYPFDLPPGRGGLHPELTLVYNSGGSNGWVGMGWELARHTIAIDTRFGVPRYDPVDESETYMLDGAQLTPFAHRGPIRRRDQDTTNTGTEQVKIFHTRVEGDFQKIIRHGTAPANYWWEVIDKLGVRHFYGGTPENPAPDPNATLGVEAGSRPGVFEWALKETRDRDGNSIRYFYERELFPSVAVPNRAVPGVELYPSRIEYTLEEGDSGGPYQVFFLREGPRPDPVIDGRGGFKRTSAALLRRLEVRFESGVVRAWELAYRTGPFHKTLLESIRQFGADDAPFPGNVHGFEYFDSITSGSNYNGFSAANAFTSPNDDVSAALGAPLGVFGDGEASGLSGVESTSIGGHVYLGFNPSAPTKPNSFGFKIGFGSSSSDGLLSFIDIDGDGLPDKVWRDGSQVFYRSNRSGPVGTATFSDGTPAQAGGLGALFRERVTTFSAGAEAYPGIASLIFNHAETFTSSDTYFSDVNGDGLPDLISGSSVRFNRRNADGSHTFVANDPSQTPFPIIPGTVDATDLLPDYSAIREENERRFPPADTVRVWEAPYSGRIDITAPVKLARVKTAAEVAAEGFDGVRVAIERATPASNAPAVELWSTAITATDGAEKDPTGVTDLAVTFGDRLYFRVQSLQNGADDEVDWNPRIAFRDIADDTFDANGLDQARYQAGDDFVLAGRRVWREVPFRGVLHLTGTLTKAATSDDVRVEVLRNGAPVFELPLGFASAETVAIDESFSVEPQDQIEARVRADSAIDVRALVFDPPLVIQYDSAEDTGGATVPVVDGRGNPIFRTALAADVDLYPRQFPGISAPPGNVARPLAPYVVQNCRTLEALAAVSLPAFDPTPTGEPLVFTAKRSNGIGGSSGTLLAKRSFSVSGSAGAQLSGVSPGELLFFEFSGRDSELIGSTVEVALVCVEAFDANQPAEPSAPVFPPSMVRASAHENRCSEPYRGWSHAAYNGGGTRADAPISELFCKLDSGSGLDEETDVPSDEDTISNEGGAFGSFRNREDITFIFAPFPEGRDCPRAAGDATACPVPAVPLWGGPDDRTYVTDVRVSASRIGPDDLRVPAPGDVARAGIGPGGISIPVISRLGRSSENSLGGGVGFGVLDFSGAHSDGSSSNELDYLDMNGDGFPDVVSSRSGIQFTDARGTLGATGLRGSLGSSVRESDTFANTLGLGGSVPTFPGNAEGDGTGSGRESAETGGSGTQMQPLGLNLSESVGTSRARSDLIDVNGDALPDRVRRVGSGDAFELEVELNLGYRFAPPEVWSGNDPNIAVSDGNSQEISAGVTLGFNTGNYAFAGGISLTRSSSAIRESPESDLAPLGELTQDRGTTLADVNGDGLIDVVRPDDGAIRVAINRGGDFAPFARWGGVPEDHADADVSLSRSTSLGGGVYFTIGIPLFPCPCSIIINPGADASASVSREEIQIADIDGDGFPDYLTSDRDSEVRAAINNTGKTNLLRRVTRPLGASMELDYQRTGNTFEHPQSRWVLSSLRTGDGVLGDGPDTMLTTYGYGQGFYDRVEREFYGFDSVVAEERNTLASGEPAYRRTRRTFHNQNFFSKGLLTSEVIAGVGTGDVDLPFSSTANTYLLRDVATRAELAPSAPHDDAGIRASLGALFPEQRVITHRRHEGVASDFVETVTEQEFDVFGNVTRVVDTGDPADNDTMIAVFTYTGAAGRHAACADQHIVGIADSMLVSGSSGLLRRREADVDCEGGDLVELREFIDGATGATTTFTYAPNGNLTRVEGPQNQLAQRYALDFGYDTRVKTYVTSVTDSYGHGSSSDYDFRFGEQTEDIDSNGQATSRRYDAFGRLTTVIGPYEQGGANATIRMDYLTDQVPAVALTRHHDAFRDPTGADTIDTVGFVDGLRRVLQTKKDATLHQGAAADPVDRVVVSGRVLFDHVGRSVEAKYPNVEDKNLASNLVFNPSPDSITATRTGYDFLDRAVAIVHPDDSVTSHTFSIAQDKVGARRLSEVITDEEGHTRGIFRDIRDQIRALREDNTTRGETIWTLYSYDEVQQLRGVSDNRDNLTRVDYDLMGRRLRIDNPDSGRTDFIYDPAGNLVRKVTANLRALSRSIAYDYHFTRLTDIRYPSFPENDVHYDYGAPTLLGDGTNRVGRIMRVSDESGVEERKYGRLGELVEETKTVASDTQGNSPNSPEIWTTSYLYDTWGRLQQLTYPDGEVLTYRYDSGGLPRQATGVKLGVSFPYLEKLEYDKFSDRVFVVTGNGIPTSLEYDAATRRLNRLRAASFQDQRFGYDRVGNVLTLSNQVPDVQPPQMGGPVDQRFGYDALHRLTSASGEWRFAPNKSSNYSLTVDYDTIHNVTRKNQNHDIVTPGGSTISQKDTTYDHTYTYGSSRPHAGTTIGSRDYVYDDSGNQIRWDEQQGGQRRTLVWDEEDRIQSIADNGQTTTFKYDDAGERVIKRGQQGETAYVNQFWTARNRSVGTKHVFVAETRIASKLSPGEAHVQPSGGRTNNQDLWVSMVGNWLSNRSDSGLEHGQNVNNNPHITGCPPPRCDSVMPPSEGLPDANFVYFYHPDHVGSTSYVTDKDGELYEHLQYFPFGETWAEENSNTERLPYLFTSKEFDQETELYYFGARYYDPRTQHWLSTDGALERYLPLLSSGRALAGSEPFTDLPGRGGVYQPLNLNLYGYGAQNPVRFVDPDGDSFISFALKMGAKAASKGMLKNFIKTRIKDRLKNLTIKKFTKQIAKEADDVLDVLEDPWWVTAIGFIPIAGDAFDLARVPMQIRKAIKKAEKLEEKLQKLLEIQFKTADKLIPARLRRGDNFPTDQIGKTYKQILDDAAAGDKGAATLKKIIEQEHRLGEIY